MPRRVMPWHLRAENNESGYAPPTMISEQFDPANGLEQMLADAGYDRDIRPTFEQRLLVEPLFIAIPDQGQAHGEQAAASDGPMQLYVMDDDDGQTYPVVFTSVDRAVECYGPDVLLAQMIGLDLFSMLIDGGAWINPASAYGVLYEANDLRRIVYG